MGGSQVSIGVQNRRHGIAPAHVMCSSKPSFVARDFPRVPRTTLNGFAPGIQIVAKMRPRSRPVLACPGTDAPDGPPQSTPCRFRFTLSQTRTISATVAEVHQNLSRRPSPDGTATRRWPVKCRRGHHGVQTRGVRAADHGIKDERHARLRALSRSVGTADGGRVTGRCRLPVNCAVSLGASWPAQRTGPHTAGCLQLHSTTTGSDHHPDRRTQHGPRRAPRAA